MPVKTFNSRSYIRVALLVNFKGKGIFRQLSILMGVIVGYLISLKMGIVETNAIKEASLLAVPAFRLPKFDIGAIDIIAQ